MSSINEEIIRLILNDEKPSISLISKAISLSKHRINKYLKNNFIDLDKINKDNYKIILDKKRIKQLKKNVIENEKIKKVDDKINKSLENKLSSTHKLPIFSNDNKIVIKTIDNKIKF